MVYPITTVAILTAGLLCPALAQASASDPVSIDLTRSGVGFAAIVIFVIAYLVVMSE